MDLNGLDLNKIATEFNEEKGFERILTSFKILTLIPQVLKYSTQTEKAIDVGCGYGYFANALSHHFSRVIGIDGSNFKIARAKRLFKNLNLEFQHKMWDDFKSEIKIDFISFINFLEHLEEPQRFLKEIKTWLSQEGIVACLVPNAFSIHKIVGLRLKILDSLFDLTPEDIKKGHFRIYSPDTLEAEFIKADFKIIAKGGLILKPLPNNEMVNWPKPAIEEMWKLGQCHPKMCSSIYVIAKPWT